jgi:integrase/recombinase XerD
MESSGTMGMLITLFIADLRGKPMRRRIQDFLKFLEIERGYSDNTVVAYQNDLTQFLDHVTSDDIGKPLANWAEADHELLIDYIDSLKESDYSSSTVARKIAALKAFFNFLVAEGDLREDLTYKLDPPKVQKRLPKALSFDEVDRLLQSPAAEDSNSPKSQRDLALLEMLYGAGMRVTELVSLDVTDLALGRTAGEVSIRGKKNSSQERDIPLSGPSLEAIRYYVEHGREQLVLHTDTPALFVNSRGQRLTRQGLWLIIKHYVKIVGISVHVTPHTLRHSFAAHKLSQGKSLQDIQILLGHANISTTQVYSHMRQDNIKELIYRKDS